MSKTPIPNSLFFLRKLCKVGVNKVKVESMMREVKREKGKEVFWMKDPKKGNWMPENYFDQVDTVDVREKLLSKNKHS